MPRLTITLTERQADALDAIAAETGATKQSMIGLAVSDWIRARDWEEPRRWQGWCRAYSDERGTSDLYAETHETEHAAIMAAKAATQRAKAEGWTSARPMWEPVR